MLNINTLYPVILPVPFEYEKMSVRDRVKFLSNYARHALVLSEKVSVNTGSLDKGIEDYLKTSGDLPKDDKGAPLPVHGRCWSVTHKPAFVGGVVSSEPVGLDIEKIKDYTKGLCGKIADPREWSLIDPEKRESFFRYWTAKEAVLKTEGVGLSELSKCRVSRIVDDLHLEISFKNRIWLAEHFYFNDHMASIVKNDFQVEWVIYFQ